MRNFLSHRSGMLINTRMGVRLKQLILINCFVLVLCFSETLYSSNVHALKSLFLFNFVNYVEWPTESFESYKAPILYCVSGNLRVLKNLRSVLKDEYYKQRKLKVIQVKSISDMKPCHIVFFGSSDKYQTPSTLNFLSKHHVLTVGEDADFLARGGMINLNYIQKHIVIEINLSNVKKGNIKISSKLLRLSKIK